MKRTESPELPGLPEGYLIKVARHYGYNTAFLYNPAGRLIADELIHTLTAGERAAESAFRNLMSIAQADAKWGTQ